MHPYPNHPKILILDFGSQYTKLIARRIRECGVFSVILPYYAGADQIQQCDPKGIILSGGPDSVYEPNSPQIPSIVFELGCPILGICYGMQAMAHQLGGRVQSEKKKEYGHAKIAIQNSALLFENISDKLGVDVWMSHGDQVAELPKGFITLANTNGTPHAAIADLNRLFFGVQFHPEVTHTPQGQRILNQFIQTICKITPYWTPNLIIQDQLEDIRKQVGNDPVILGLSGGVDSSVVALLLHRAIGSKLQCIFVDNGLLRINESHDLMQYFTETIGIRVQRVDASHRFLNALKGVTDPETKRKIIGQVFIDVFEEAAKQHQEARWLAQGTIYPDVIESAANGLHTADLIKSHHNVGGLPEHLSFKLLEPLRTLFKDEVRSIGIELGLPSHFVHKHPFPGPGLAVRIIGEVTPDALNIVRKADVIFMEELCHTNLYEQISQAFAVFLPIQSVGVTGDARNYAPVIALRAVKTSDFMTAEWFPFPHDVLAHISHRITNEIPGVSRVVYDISGKPPATIEWE